jgi:hypothetical protein
MQKLPGIHLGRLDFQGAVFDRADPRKAVLGESAGLPPGAGQARLTASAGLKTR